jgi:hypothetical protein
MTERPTETIATRGMVTGSAFKSIGTRANCTAAPFVNSRWVGGPSATRRLE